MQVDGFLEFTLAAEAIRKVMSNVKRVWVFCTVQTLVECQHFDSVTKRVWAPPFLGLKKAAMLVGLGKKYLSQG